MPKKFLVIWWMEQTPYAAPFDNQISAEAFANIRNALMITFPSRMPKIDSILDWYRRDDQGRPMPAEWREQTSKSKLTALPWMTPAPHPRL